MEKIVQLLVMAAFVWTGWHVLAGLFSATAASQTWKEASRTSSSRSVHSWDSMRSLDAQACFWEAGSVSSAGLACAHGEPTAEGNALPARRKRSLIETVADLPGRDRIASRARHFSISAPDQALVRLLPLERAFGVSLLLRLFHSSWDQGGCLAPCRKKRLV